MHPRAHLLAARTCCGLVLVALASFYLLAAREVFPAPMSDAGPHLIPVLNQKAGLGLVGTYWELTRTYDPTGRHRFLQYPPLFHLVLSSLIPTPTVEALYTCLGWMAVATLGACAALMWQGARDVPGTRRPAWVWLATAGLCAVSTWLYLRPASGRPEALTALLITLAALLLRWVRPSWRPVAAGVFVGLVAGAQVVNAILLGLMYSTFISLCRPGEPRAAPRWRREIGTAAAVSVPIFLLCLAMGPHPVGETLRGIFVHARQLDSVRYAVWLNYFSPDSINNSFYGVFLLAFLGGFLWWGRARLEALVLVNLGLLCLAVWYFAVRASDLSYNVYAFVPMLVSVGVRALARLDPDTPAPGAPRRRRILLASAFVLCGLMSIGLLRHGIIFALYKAYGVSYAEARRQLAAQLPPGESTPLFTQYSLWPLAARFDHLYLYQPNKADKPGYMTEPTPPMLMVQQWYERRFTPPPMPGYRLVWSDFIEHPTPRVLGLQLSATTPGYAFALYEPVAP